MERTNKGEGSNIGTHKTPHCVIWQVLTIRALCLSPRSNTSAQFSMASRIAKDCFETLPNTVCLPSTKNAESKTREKVSTAAKKMYRTQGGDGRRARTPIGTTWINNNHELRVICMRPRVSHANDAVPIV